MTERAWHRVVSGLLVTACGVFLANAAAALYGHAGAVVVAVGAGALGYWLGGAEPEGEAPDA